MKNIVVIGGGHGQATILKGLKLLDDIHISAIVTVADDGGSTGRLRRRFHIPAMGDVRNVMIALAKSEPLITELMDYRFDDLDGEDIGGHNLGNLILTALTQQKNSFMEAISDISKVLNVAGDIIPSTTQVVTLIAEMEDGTIVAGESNIPNYANKIKRVYYQENVKATDSAVRAIFEADMIVFGIGSLYTSILPNIIISGIKEAICNSTASKVYICNAMTQHGETDNYTLEDHVRAIEDHLGKTIDLVIYADDKIPEEALESYVKESAYPVKISAGNHHYKVIEYQLLNFEGNLIRHDPQRIERLFADLLERKI